ncbi:MAG: protein-export chaperone SecB [Syntrophobacteraceae bacterium]|nr:protein-export chaperone SecB [Syntrophobacteraceae bacterium]
MLPGICASTRTAACALQPHIPSERSYNTIQKELRKQYAAVNCPAIIFPYLRETLADLTRRAAFPPLHLPITNFTKFAHKDAGKHEGASVKAETLHKRKPKEPSRGRKKATRGTASKQREN